MSSIPDKEKVINVNSTELSSDSEDSRSLAKSLPKKFFFWQGFEPSGIELDDIATQRSVFDDDSIGHHYRPCDEYENLHRFDPSFRWTWRDEIRLVRKLDFRIMFFVGLLFGALQLDRGNISQATADTFLKDLKLSTNDFNNGNTLFTVCFLLAELPSQLISKKLGPDKWVPTQMVLWSIVAGSQFWIQNRAGFFATRCLLGALQGKWKQWVSVSVSISEKTIYRKFYTNIKKAVSLLIVPCIYLTSIPVLSLLSD